MTLITCCPACGTMFKVVPDQLRISEGWVRCGHCSKVFDATVHMQGDKPAAAREPEPALAEASTEGLAQAPEYTPLQPPVAVFEDETPSQATALTHVTTEAPWEPVLGLKRADAFEPEPAESLPSRFDPSAEPLAQVEPEPAPEVHDVSFMRQARRKAFWRRPLVRAALALLVLVLGAVLALQVAVQDRDRIAALQPELKPWLDMLCEPLACTVGPPHQIEAIVIDSSSFNKLRSDAYRLNFTLKNQGAVAVAIPAIELTLTDTQDQPVLRRVLQPAEMGATSSVVPAASDWSGSLALNVAANGSTGRIAGYRLLAFYP